MSGNARARAAAEAAAAAEALRGQLMEAVGLSAARHDGRLRTAQRPPADVVDRDGGGNDRGGGDSAGQDSDDSQRTRPGHDADMDVDSRDDGSNVFEDFEEVDPYDVDAYKIRHSGAESCRGRNVVGILDDRMLFGARYTNPSYLVGIGGGGDVVDRVGRGDADADNVSMINSPKSNEGGGMPRDESVGNANVDCAAFQSTPTPSTQQEGRRTPTLPRSRPTTPTQQQSRHQNQYQTPPLGGKDNSLAESTLAPHDRRKTPQSAERVLHGLNNYRPSSPMDVTSEIRSFAEYAAATKFKASYLNHLNGEEESPPVRPNLEIHETDRQLRQHLMQHALPQRRMARGNPPGWGGGNAGGGMAQLPAGAPGPPAVREAHRRGRGYPSVHYQHPAGGGRHTWGDHRPQLPHQPTRAVSTISIAHSPDARTLASTHGDHTVKITCAHTGRLVRQLEGHPRTPWTVKYHPTNPRIVASGCLGFQVRVWDWNFQTAKMRRERKERGERRWRGRYDFGRGSGNAKRGPGMAGTDVVGLFGTSPRGVVEHPWKRPGTENRDGDDRRRSWDAAPQSQSQAFDEFASSTYAAAGLPTDDPAWYDVESEMFNYEHGIGVCLNMIRLKSAVISLNFHPTGEVLAMASGQTLHLWDYNEDGRKRKRGDDIAAGGESESRIINRSLNEDFPRQRTLDFRHELALRCVHFPPCGTLLIVGGVNPPKHNDGLPPGGGRTGRDPRSRGGMSGGGMSFHLRLWDFDLDAVLCPSARDGPLIHPGSGSPARAGAAADGDGQLVREAHISDEGELTWNYAVVKEAIANPRTIIPRVLLYNDGGFDLSTDGKVLSACADFWLPEGVDNVMELIHSQQKKEEEEEEERQKLEQQLTKQMLSSAGNTTDRPTSPVAGMGDSVEVDLSSPVARSGQQSIVNPQNLHPLPSSFPDPRTPPPNTRLSLEPPSPPGKRNLTNLPRQPKHIPHPLSVVAPENPAYLGGEGRYVPHIVTVSLDTSPPPSGEPLPLHPKIVRTETMRMYPNLGAILQAAPLHGNKSAGVTCVKLSPTAEYCLLGYGVRESMENGGEVRHPVTSIYNVKKGMQHVCTLTCADDDVNIARFHPESGHGFVYGTKQGRVRVLATRPWNYSNP